MTDHSPDDEDTVLFTVAYDRRADVLYISTRAGADVEGRLDRNGIVWRSDPEGNIVAATIMDFKDRWSIHSSELAGKISRRFHLPEHQAQRVVDKALLTTSSRTQ